MSRADRPPAPAWRRAKHRFFVAPAARQGERVTLTAAQAAQVSRVLRLRPGDLVVALDGLGHEWLLRLESLSRASASGTIIAERPARGEPRTRITLHQALLPREKFELVLQKGTEIGVSVFVPVVSERSLARGPLEESRLARWQHIVREAAEQAHRGAIPRVAQAVSLARALQERDPASLGILASPSAARSMAAVLRAGLPRAAVDLWIGPEGGFSEAEVRQAEQGGLQVATLGPRVLRTETAGLALAALVLYEAGELVAGGDDDTDERGRGD